MPSDTDEINTLLSTYSDIHESGKIFLTTATDDFKFVRPSGNPVDAEEYARMFESGDVVVTASKLAKIHKIDVFGDTAFTAFTQMASFTYKGTPNDDVFTVSALLKKMDGSWKFAWMHRSSGESDLAAWD